MKPCTQCRVEKVQEDFFRRSQAKDGRTSQCKECTKKYYREGGHPKQHEYNLKYFFGLSPEEYAEIIRSQGGGCAICGGGERARSRTGGKRRLAVDHCHETGAIRGVLCGACNAALGLTRENIETLTAMIDYLRRDPLPVGCARNNRSKNS